MWYLFPTWHLIIICFFAGNLNSVRRYLPDEVAVNSWRCTNMNMNRRRRRSTKFHAKHKQTSKQTTRLALFCTNLDGITLSPPQYLFHHHHLWDESQNSNSYPKCSTCIKHKMHKRLSQSVTSIIIHPPCIRSCYFESQESSCQPYFSYPHV
jgi:hypothetical protein